MEQKIAYSNKADRRAKSLAANREGFHSIADDFIEGWQPGDEMEGTLTVSDASDIAPPTQDQLDREAALKTAMTKVQAKNGLTDAEMNALGWTLPVP